MEPRGVSGRTPRLSLGQRSDWLSDEGLSPCRGSVVVTCPVTCNRRRPRRELPRNTDIALNQISPDYFRVLKVPLLRGRLFADADSQNSEAVVILNEAAAARYFPGEDAVGKVVRLVGNRTVVGVAGDIRHDGPESGWRTQAFVPLAPSRVFGATLVVRTASGAQGILPAVRQAIWSEFPDALPTRLDEHALTYYLDALVARRRFDMLLLALFGVLGLSIASVGIYGVMGYVVSQRTQEIARADLKSIRRYSERLGVPIARLSTWRRCATP
jgi:MacB-like protein